MNEIMKGLKGICIILLTAGIIVLGLIQIASSTILSKDYIIKKLEETNYYANTYMQVKNDFENYIYQSGLDKEVIDNIVSIEDIKKDTNIIISNIYDGIEKKIDADKLKENLNNNINKSLEGKNIPLATQKAIDKFVEQIVNQYKDSISHTQFENEIYEGFQKAKKYIAVARTISSIMIGVSSIAILAINNKKYWRSIANIGIPFVSSGLFYEFANIYINSRVKIANIMILNDAITVSLREYISDAFAMIRNIGLGFIVLGIVLIITGSSIRAKKHTTHKKNDSI